MCIVIVAFQYRAGHPLVVAANRDEQHARPTRMADFWAEAPDVLAGRDLEAGGTWLGVTRDGRFAAVTNYAEPPLDPAPPRSRGELTRDFLLSDAEPEDYCAWVAEKGELYRGFNLLVGDRTALGYVSNRVPGYRMLGPGIYAVANHLLDTEWPKVRRGKRGLSEMLGGAPEELFAVLDDSSLPPDAELPQRGNDLEFERRVAPCFIIGQDYGTRASTVVHMSDDRLSFIEHNFGPNALPGPRRAWDLPLEPVSGSSAVSRRAFR